MQSLTTAILSNSAGKLNHNSLINRNDNNPSPSPQKVKSIAVNGRMIQFTSDTRPEPPTLSYKTKADLEQLVKDWTNSSLITIDGIGVPLGLWKKSYKRTHPGVWERIKDQWTKFIVGGFKIFNTPEKFWAAMSLALTMPDSKVINFRKISETMRKIRGERDSEDIEKARAKCKEDEYQSRFSYKKRKVYIMAKPKDIACRY